MPPIATSFSPWTWMQDTAATPAFAFVIRSDIIFTLLYSSLKCADDSYSWAEQLCVITDPSPHLEQCLEDHDQGLQGGVCNHLEKHNQQQQLCILTQMGAGGEGLAVWHSTRAHNLQLPLLLTVVGMLSRCQEAHLLGNEGCCLWP
jgi:hypothetical protein